MRCPVCAHSKTKVIDSREVNSGQTIRRRRVCLKCRHRFSTYEKQEESQLTVIKKGGVREPFNGSKILDGLIRATVKLEVPRETLDELVADIENELRGSLLPEVPSSDIGEMILARLREINKVAYVRFASVYREFKDPEEFTKELARLQKRKK